MSATSSSPPHPAPHLSVKGRETRLGAMARQQIVDAEGKVVGYELFDRSHAVGEHTPASDVSLIFQILSHIGEEDLLGEHLQFINCTHNSLAGGHLDLVHPDRLVLEIPALDTEDSEEIFNRQQNLLRLKQQGFKLAFGEFILTPPYAAWLKLASYIKIDLSKFDEAGLEEQVQLALQRSLATLIGEKVETEAQRQHAQGLGITLFQGYLYGEPQLVKLRRMMPSHDVLAQLIQLFRGQPRPEAIEHVLKKDPALAFNLLRLTRTSGLAHGQRIETLHQAIALMGTKRLFRWAALMLSGSVPNDLPSPLADMVVVRARLMEVMALHLFEPAEAEKAMLAGLLSLLDVMAEQPMENAVRLIDLPDRVSALLLHRQGPYLNLLELAEACELGNDAALREVCKNLNISKDQGEWAYTQALEWAQNSA